MIVSLIAAATENHVIGFEGGMPWHLPNDLRYFKRTTIGHHIIMGRKTFEEFGLRKPLPKRTNIVLTRQNLSIKGCIVMNDLTKALNLAKAAGETEAFIIGGEQIYRLAMPLANRIYLTKIHTELKGDTFFPEIKPQVWKQLSAEKHYTDDKHDYNYTFTVWEKQY